MSVSVAAIDLGASSGRVMVGDVGPRHLKLRAVARFANEAVRSSDGLHWDPLELYRRALLGLRTAVSLSHHGLRSVAVDSWAVDYALMRGDRMLGSPFHYRDERTITGVERIHAVIRPEELYARNGLQFLSFNTLYQLAADPLVDQADRMLLIPDLVGYWLTGRSVTERTNASTTGLLDVHTGTWDLALAERLGLPRTLFTDLVSPGDVIGNVTPAVGEKVGDRALMVTAVGSHDTASAVVGVPMKGDDAAYISCGTWGLVGVELESPILTDEARRANFTNEGGVEGRIRFLTNVMGTWLLSETLRGWASTAPLDQLLREATNVTGQIPVFDVQDPRFLPPGDMPQRITSWFAENDKPAPQDRATLVRSIVESLAQAFADAIETAEKLSGQTIGVVHLVGGGAQNELLCQATANRSGRPVVAGPVEATALGSVLVQSRALGELRGGLDEMRRLVADTHSLARFEPRT
ncbi:rhamnulokinase [Aeromicrobium sp.]|uniref:rhamnulokinase n=1 Tax=Aeromicrobium sp. TaxID=1871063 RepID=UPI002FC99295